MSAHLLVIAKAPVPGLAKTRLGEVIGHDRAASLAAAALLDTLEAGREAFGDRCHLALDGDLSEASDRAEIREALRGWQVFEQVGDSFGARLAHAHARVAADGTGAVVQVGMDTPQLTSTLLREAADHLDAGAEVVLGPAEDGGWWIIGLADGRDAEALTEVPMSTPQTYTETVRALHRRGRRTVPVTPLRDVDTVADAIEVAGSAPTTRFARAWARVGTP